MDFVKPPSPLPGGGALQHSLPWQGEGLLSHETFTRKLTVIGHLSLT